MKRWLKPGLTLILAVVIAFLGISGFLGYSMTKVVRVPLEENPALLGLKYEDVSFSSRVDDLTLRGWYYLPVQNSQPVITRRETFWARLTILKTLALKVLECWAFPWELSPPL